MLTRRNRVLWPILLTLGACASSTPPPSTASYVRAKAEPEPPRPKPVVVEVPPAPAPATQLKSLPATSAVARKPPPPEQVVAEANRKAAEAPAESGFFNAIMQYPFSPGSLFQIYAAPMRVVDINLEPGERIIGQPACGDVVRWVLAVGRSMSHGAEQWHVYLKPTRPDLETNLAINTDRRTYLLELHSFREAYMAAVSWRYPEDEVAHLEGEARMLEAMEKDAAPVVSVEALNFKYEVKVTEGKPAWTPLQVFDDGRKTFIRFPPGMLVRESPALFVWRDKETQLVNYRVRNELYIVDRLFDSAELRLGQKDQEIVRINRVSASGG